MALSSKVVSNNLVPTESWSSSTAAFKMTAFGGIMQQLKCDHQWRLCHFLLVEVDSGVL